MTREEDAFWLLLLLPLTRDAMMSLCVSEWPFEVIFCPPPSCTEKWVSALGESWWCGWRCVQYTNLFSPPQPLQQTLYREATNVRRKRGKIYKNNSLTATPQPSLAMKDHFLVPLMTLDFSWRICVRHVTYIFFLFAFFHSCKASSVNWCVKKRWEKRRKKREVHSFPSKKVSSPEPSHQLPLPLFLHLVNCICLKGTE